MRRGAAVVIALAALVVGFAWAMSSPVGSSPDDDFHLTNIWCPPPLESSGCEVVTARDGSVGVVVPELVATPQECFAFKPFTSAACQEGLSNEATQVSTRVNEGLYPGPYYSIMHAFVGPDVARSVLVMRAANVLITVSLLTALAVLANTSTRRLLAYSVLASIVPLGVFVVASVNPSSWALTGAIAVWFALYQLMDEQRRWAVGVLIALYVAGAGLAIASRGDAAAFVVVVSAAVLFVRWKDALSRPLRLVAPAVLSLLGIAVFVLVNQTQALSAGLGRLDLPRSGLQVFVSNVTELPRYLFGLVGYQYAGAVGGLGWLDTAMPAITVIGAGFVVFGLLFVGLSVLTPRKATSLALLWLALAGLPLVVLQVSLSVVGENVQPRYVLPLLPPLLATAMLAANPARSLSMRGGQALVAFVLLSAAHGAALQANIRRYVTGAEQGGINLSEGAEWWWPNLPSPMVVWVVGSLAFVVVASSVFLVDERSRWSLAGRRDQRAGAAAGA